jgi:hypothetical protein
MKRRLFIVSSGLLVVGSSIQFGREALGQAGGLPTKTFTNADGNLRYQITWDRAVGFSGFAWVETSAAEKNKEFHCVKAGYPNEQGKLELDNGVATAVRPPELLRIRVLFQDRNDGSIFSKAGDVISAYSPSSGAEKHWLYGGNLVS